MPGAPAPAAAPAPIASPGVDTTPPGAPPEGAPVPGALAPASVPAAADPAAPMPVAADPVQAAVPAGAAEPDKVEIILAVVAFLVTVGAVVVLALMKVE